MSEYTIEQPKKSGRKLLMLLAVLVLAAGLVAVVYYFTKVNRARTQESIPIEFTVSRGLNTRQIASALDEKKIINNKTIFILYSNLNGAGNKIQAGEYLLNSNMTVTEIVDVLTNGKVVSDTRNVTIIEGRSNSQIAAFLAGRGIVKTESEFLQILSAENFDFKFESTVDVFSAKTKSLPTTEPAASSEKYQGFLFPDTYTLSKDNTTFDLISKMLNNFESKITEQMLSDLEKQKRKLSDVLILASIVEKEVGRNKENITDSDLVLMQKERELVASVFYNRLAVGMALESDATVNYVTGKSDRSATIADTKIKSAFNTYQVRGLPPIPISNPGIGSIQATINPAESDYLFFLNSPEGVAYFAKTLDEHNANRVKYLR